MEDCRASSTLTDWKSPLQGKVENFHSWWCRQGQRCPEESRGGVGELAGKADLKWLQANLDPCLMPYK